MVTTVDTSSFVDIDTAEELAQIEMNRSYRLTADIDLSGLEWTPLGSASQPYLGIFDGNGHTISNLTITQQNDGHLGLFARLAGTVHDLNILDFSMDINSDSILYAGGLAGRLQGDVENVEVSGDITLECTSSNVFVGLLAGQSDAVVTDTMAAADFVANSVEMVDASGTITVEAKYLVYAGGLIGKIYNSIVHNTQIDVTMDVVASGDFRAFAGGLVGHHYGGLLIGFEEYVEDVDLPIFNNLVEATITLDAAGSQGVAAGYAGYSQYGIFHDNLVDVTLVLKGKTLYGSLFVGEAFNGRFDRNLGIGSIGAVNEENQIVTITALYGFSDDLTEWTSNFYSLETELPISSGFDTGEEASLTDLSDPAWYGTWMSWDETFLSYTAIATLFGE
jgi:hypothetical protein